jgi:hypothetical protein
MLRLRRGSPAWVHLTRRGRLESSAAFPLFLRKASYLKSLRIWPRGGMLIAKGNCRFVRLSVQGKTLQRFRAKRLHLKEITVTLNVYILSAGNLQSTPFGVINEEKEK